LPNRIAKSHCQIALPNRIANYAPGAMRILFVKTSSLGDVIHHCPAISDVRRSLPHAAIDWVVEEPFAQIAALHPAVRKVLPVAVRRWRSRLLAPEIWREMLAFRRELQVESYDAIIDAQGLMKSALIVAVCNGVKHGLDAASAREPLASRFYDFVHAVPREMHAVERNRRLTAAALGIDIGAGCEYGLRLQSASPIAPRSPFCVLLSMTSRAGKLWQEERWAELVRALAGRGCESVLPWGDEAERTRALAIVAAAGRGLVPPRMTLVQLASLMHGAHAVFGVDTGLAHLAAAVGVPTIGIYCGSDPALTGLHAKRVANLGGPGCPPTASDALAALESLI